MNFNLEIISLVVCISSFLSLTFFVYKKIQVLSGLPEREVFPVGRIKRDAEEKLRIAFKQRMHLLEEHLQKRLHKMRLFFLRADNRATDWIGKLRERSEKRRIDMEDHWKDLKITIPVKRNKK